MKHFNRVWRKWKPFSEYYSNPWAYFCSFIEILQKRKSRFLTMSQALSGDYVESDINVVLDHHIDHYPLETEVMAKWELENDVVSSIYLFNRFEQSTGAQQAWELEDLNISFYQLLESRGFEIGYHQNVVGNTRYRRTGSRYPKRISGQAEERAYGPEFMAQAALLFREDVENLQRYFNIKTFIPHGGGEDNTAFKAFPNDLAGLVWAYNHAGSEGHGQRRLRWRNFSDSSGPRFQKFRAKGATYFLQRDNLHAVGHALQPGLNHILLHPGRYSKGMPYESIGISPYETSLYSDASYTLSPELEEPIDVPKLVKKWAAHVNVAITPPSDQHDVLAKYYLFTDDERILLNHMAFKKNCIGFFVVHEDATREVAASYSSRRATVNPSNKLLEIDDASPDFLDAFERFYNVVFSRDLPRHLGQVDFGPRYVYLKRN